MDIIKQNIDELGALLKVQIAKNDYEENVKKSLSSYRRKAEIKGFRSGMAPMSLIQKMYGRSVLVDEINKLISDSLGKYIEDEELDIIGEPIPCDDEQKPIDWDNETDFEFVYEIGYSPKFELQIDKQIEVPFYNITVSEADKKKQIENIQQRYGKLEQGELVGEDDIFKANFNQSGDDAINIEDTYVSMRAIETKKQKKSFLGLKVGDTVEVDINKIYNKDADKAALLKVKEDELVNINPVFNVTVNEVKTFKKAEVNQELFDSAYGKDSVKSEKEFKQRITDEISKAYIEEENYKFSIDVRESLIAKAELKFPNNFLKKWLLLINEGKLTEEQVDKDFDAFVKDLSWQLIRNNIAKENDLNIDEADMKAQAIKIARYQLMQYGLSNLPDEQLEGFAQRILDDKRQSRDVAEKVIEDKVFAHLKNVVTLKEESITVEDFGKLFEETK